MDEANSRIAAEAAVQAVYEGRLNGRRPESKAETAAHAVIDHDERSRFFDERPRERVVDSLARAIVRDEDPTKPVMTHMDMVRVMLADGAIQAEAVAKLSSNRMIGPQSVDFGVEPGLVDSLSAKDLAVAASGDFSKLSGKASRTVEANLGMAQITPADREVEADIAVGVGVIRSEDYASHYMMPKEGMVDLVSLLPEKARVVSDRRFGRPEGRPDKEAFLSMIQEMRAGRPSAARTKGPRTAPDSIPPRSTGRGM
jgi:hypothetical protein